MTKDQDMSTVQKHLQALSEHFDTVQIFCTRHEAGEHDGTIDVQVGAGNWFARYGHVKHWLVTQEERDRQRVRREDE